MPSENIIYHSIRKDQVIPFVDLIRSHGITLLGLSDNSFFCDIFSNAVKSGNPKVILATTHTYEIIGWTISIINSRNYWYKFLLTHPYYIFKIFLSNYNSEKNLNNYDLPSTGKRLNWPNLSNIEWGQSKKSIARHVDITVLENKRHLGIGKMLYSEQDKFLKNDLVFRIDACIREENTISQNFHIKLGWSLVKDEDGWVYITKDLRN